MITALIVSAAYIAAQMLADIASLRGDLVEFVDATTPLIPEDETRRDTQPTLGFQRVLQRAVFHVQSSGKSEVTGANVLVAIFSEQESQAVYLLKKQNIARIDVDTGTATVVEPPTSNQGARRVWSDSRGRLWVSYWNTGHVGMYDPAARAWREWKLPGSAHTYSVWVDPADRVWLTDWSTNAIVRFDPATERFDSFPSDRERANVRQMLGRAGEAWGAESGTDRLVMVPAP